MRHRYIAAGLCALSLSLICLGYLLYHHPGLLGLCNPGEQCLSDDLFYGVANPLYLHIYPLPVLFAALVFVPPEIWSVWVKFFLAISIIPFMLIIGADPISQSFFPGFPDRPQMTDLMVRFVVGASAVFITGALAARHWRNLRNRA